MVKEKSEKIKSTKEKSAKKPEVKKAVETVVKKPAVKERKPVAGVPLVKKTPAKAVEKPVVKTTFKTAAVKKAVIKLAIKKTAKKTVEPDVMKIPAAKVTEKPYKKPGHPSLVYKKYDDKITDFYGDTRIVLLTRDPYCIFAYWEVSLPRIEEAKKELGQEFYSSKSILRVYEVTNINFNGKNAHGSFDVTLENMVISYYLNVYAPEKSWVVDIGILAPSGKFFTLARSNAVSTPTDSVSNADYEEWLDSSEAWKMYVTKGRKENAGGSEALYGSELRPFDSTSGSGGVSSLSSPVKYEKKPSAFWMRVGTELIVYGATEPDAAVTINNNPVQLNPDGSFSTRFALVDGIHTLDIVGRSADGKNKKSFKIVVTQDTAGSDRI